MDWTKKEVNHTVDVYFQMLQYELKHLKYNKTDYRRKLIPYLNNRSHSAVEQKNRNISAILGRIGQPYIKGYKFLPHYQQLLEESVLSYVQKHKDALEPYFNQFAEEVPIQQPIANINLSKIETAGPNGKFSIPAREPKFRPIKTNYLEKEQNNHVLGLQGEELVIEYEKWRLIKEGKKSFVNRIEWTSKEKGDGAGYDILSKNNDGSDRFIEVKTTKLSKETPIFLTFNESQFASENRKNFYLYRIYNWASNPKLFIKNGNYADFCFLEPTVYRGTFKNQRVN